MTALDRVVVSIREEEMNSVLVCTHVEYASLIAHIVNIPPLLPSPPLPMCCSEALIDEIHKDIATARERVQEAEVAELAKRLAQMNTTDHEQ